MRPEPLLVAALLLLLPCGLAAQKAPSSNPDRLTVTFVPAVVYPPIALAARVMGDVQLKITLDADGSVDKIESASGPPMLLQSAVDAVRKARFQCDGCQAGQQHAFTVRFEFGDSRCGEVDRNTAYPRVKADGSTLIIAAQPFKTCDPAATRVRSARCAYLWRCGWREED